MDILMELVSAAVNGFITGFLISGAIIVSLMGLIGLCIGIMGLWYILMGLLN